MKMVFPVSFMGVTLVYTSRRAGATRGQGLSRHRLNPPRPHRTMPAMPPPIPVLLAPYDPEWPRLAPAHAQRLSALGPVLVAVHHIGSTSVPGLAAKPIIELMPLVTSLAGLDRERRRVEALGYGWHGELDIPGRRYCTLANDSGVRRVQLHFFQADSPHVARHVAFRDYLRSRPDVARTYEEEKRRAQGLHPLDSHAYADEKAAWVRTREAEAIVWFAGQRGTGRTGQAPG
jgi:GrpB-like predicted nucleotidyltransferase (UPF0157 family)